MAALWTPGKWQVEGARHSGDLKIGPGTRLHMVGPDGDAVAAVFFDMKTGRGWADAHLIAAAPDLYEALANNVDRNRLYMGDNLAFAGETDKRIMAMSIEALKRARNER